MAPEFRTKSPIPAGSTTKDFGAVESLAGGTNRTHCFAARWSASVEFEAGVYIFHSSTDNGPSLQYKRVLEY